MTPRLAPQFRTMTYAEYLAAEEVSEVKHEYLQGEVWPTHSDESAMSPGGTIAHAARAVRVAVAFDAALRGRSCQVFSSDARVRIPGTGLSTYPDLTVVCGPVETAADDPHAITNPIVVVEVLSRSTEMYDRWAKFGHYRRLPSLQAYVLVSPLEPRIEVYRRTAADWLLWQDARAGDQVVIPGVDITLDVDAIYANPLPEAPA